MWAEEFKTLIFEQSSEVLKSGYDYEFSPEEEASFYLQMDDRLLQIV